jgi:hypothetical protein
MRRPLAGWACLLLGMVAHGLLPGMTRADSGWVVRSFDVELPIQADALLDVTETIDAEFLQPKRGIIREIPIRHAVGMHLYDLRFQFLGVDDGGGKSYQASLTYEENRVRIRIGDPDIRLTGSVRYRIRYRVERAILWEGNRSWGVAAADQDRAVLRWNATGTEWGVPIDRTRVTVRLPRDVDDAQLDADAVTGAYGARNRGFNKRRIDGRTIAFETGALRPGEGITIEVSMPGDIVARPGLMRQVSWWLMDNFPYGLIPIALVSCVAAWFFRGRDLPGRGTIVVNYEPPDGFGPAEVGTLIDEKVDLRDISAVFIDLAVRGYIKIAEVPSGGGFFSKTDYQFTRLKDAGDLKPYERRLYDKLFEGRNTVLMSELETKFYPVFGQVVNDLYEGLSRDGYFDGNPEGVRLGFLILGCLALAAALLLAGLVQFWMLGRVFVLPIILTAIAGVICVAITSRVMPRKSQKGRIAWERIAGLEEYIRRAEVDDIKAQERQGIFERLLPYAIVLGLSDRWSKAFADLYTQPPDWYEPADPLNYSMWRFNNDINRSIVLMNSSLPAVPRSSGTTVGPTGQGYGWSSGGFSGGGYSGGGFGGGGGSSW